MASGLTSVATQSRVVAENLLRLIGAETVRRSSSPSASS
jgi:hypothetical protein